MSDLRKAAQAALEWIESGSGIDFYPTDVLVGLRAALAQPDQPTADGPTREDGRADISLTASDRGLPEPAYAFAGLEGEPDITAYSADQMLAFRAEGKAEGVAQERERWRAAALAGTSGTQPRYAEALRNLVAMLDADVDRLPNVIR